MKIKYRLLILALTLLSSISFAADKRKTSLYLGGGLTRNSDQRTFSSGAAQFTGWGANGTIGIDFQVFDDWGLVAGGEYATADLNNDSSGNFIERAQLTRKAVKAGIFFDKFTFGYGSADDSLTVKYVSTSITSEVTYKDIRPFYFASVGFFNDRHLRTNLEVQYSNSPTNDSAANFYSIGIQIQYLFAK